MISPPMASSKITSDLEGSMEDEMKRIKKDADDDDKVIKFKDEIKTDLAGDLNDNKRIKEDVDDKLIIKLKDEIKANLVGDMNDMKRIKENVEDNLQLRRHSKRSFQTCRKAPTMRITSWRWEG